MRDHAEPDRCRSCVEDANTIVSNDLPEAVRLGPVGRSLVHEGGGTIGERTVDKITMSGNPAYVGGAPVDILFAQIKDIFGCGIGPVLQ